MNVASGSSVSMTSLPSSSSRRRAATTSCYAKTRHRTGYESRSSSSPVYGTIGHFLFDDYYRAMLCRCPSVCPSRAGIPSQQLNVLSDIFHRRIATPSWFFRTTRYGNIPTGTPLVGTLNTGEGLKKSRFSTNISLYLGNVDTHKKLRKVARNI